MKSKVYELEAAVRSRVCKVCRDRSVIGTCNLKDPSGCTLFQLFPLVAQAVRATDSDNIQDYVDAIRENVCSVCLEQALDGSCTQREQLRCALDAYLVSIVDAIHEAANKPVGECGHGTEAVSPNAG